MGASNSDKSLSSAKSLTFVFDREADDFDLFGTVDSTKSTFPTPKQNPFTPNYDPFSDIWAEDEVQHFWLGELMTLLSVWALL